MNVKKIPINKIKKRKRVRENLRGIRDLAKNIEEYDLLNPITVIPLDDGYFLLLAGERRLEACKLLGWKEIDANVLEKEILRGAVTK